jgi:hypothetical protein
MEVARRYLESELVGITHDSKLVREHRTGNGFSLFASEPIHQFDDLPHTSQA